MTITLSIKCALAPAIATPVDSVPINAVVVADDDDMNFRLVGSG